MSVAAAASPAGRSRSGRALPWLGVLALSFASYANGLTGEFLYDDLIYIVDNPQVSGDSISEVFTEPLALKNHLGLYRPLTLLTYRWQSGAAASNSPFPLHLVNAVLHALVACMVVALGLRWQLRRGLCFLAGLVFACHPMHVEAVTWIVGRAELLAALFSLITLWAWFGPRHWRMTTLAIVAWVLACFSKEGALTLPVTILVAEWLLPSKEGDPKRSRWSRYLGFVIAGAALVALRIAVIGAFGPDSSAATYRQYGLPERCLIACNLAADYLRLSLLPWPNRIFYHYTESVGFRWHTWVWLGMAAVALIAWMRRRSPLAFLLTAFFLSLGPVLNLVPIQECLAERFLYLPTVFLSFVIATPLLAALDWERRRTQRLGWSLLAPGIVLTAGTCLTLAANRPYQSALDLWGHVSALAPELPFPHYQLGFFFYEQEIYTSRSSEVRGALTEMKTAIRLSDELEARGDRGMPNDQRARAHLTLGILYLRLLPPHMRKLDRAEFHLRESARVASRSKALDPEWARALHELAGLIQYPGTSITQEEALGFLEVATGLPGIDPEYRAELKRSLDTLRELMD